MVERSSEGPPARPDSAEQGGFLRHVLPALLWAVAIFIGGGGGIPQVTGEGLGIPYDKVMHVGAFLAMQALCFRALRYELRDRSRGSLLLLAAVLSILFGIALEVYQMGLPDRSAELSDAVADGIVAALGALLLTKVPWG